MYETENVSLLNVSKIIMHAVSLIYYSTTAYYEKTI